MDQDFLLNTEPAKRLYHDIAEKLPIIDYHNHLNVEELEAGKKYGNLAQLWLNGDPYKHRAMRICGVEEEYITGKAGDYEKYCAWMKVLPKLIGNPLYDWSILEMKRIFDIDLKPGATDAGQLWKTVNEKLKEEGFAAGRILEKFRVEYAAPCTLLTDDLQKFSSLSFVCPSLRGDSIADISRETVGELEKSTGIGISSLQEYKKAVSVRLKAFRDAGCRFSDHALDDGFRYVSDDGKNEGRFLKILQGKIPAQEEKTALVSEMLRFLADSYAQLGWTMQLHIGAQRFTSTRLRKLAGPAGGFAGIGNCCDVSSLTRMLDAFEQGENGMPKVILFTLNPADNAVMSVLSGSYSEDGVCGKVQQGPAWWWCDHHFGMREVFENISAYGVLSAFLGMTTDSRSILSFVRHEYFRRALCRYIGEKVSSGEWMATEECLQKLVSDICYYNVKKRIS